MKIPRKELPAFVRRCWEQAKKANRENRLREIERAKFYVGGRHQWRDEEITKRESQGRPYVTINKCKPAVDQIEGDIRLNPPGPQCHPVGEHGPDHADPDIIDGLIREVEYRSKARTAYSTAGKYSATTGCAYIELTTEWTGEREWSQQLKILSVEDPDTVFFDPTARMANRQDAGWAGKLKMYNRQEYAQAFGATNKYTGKRNRVLEPRSLQSAMGWIQEAIGVDGEMRSINEWTGSGEGNKPGDGPFYVAEFYMVEIEQRSLKLYSDGVSRFEDELIPKGVKALEGEQYERKSPKRTVTKFVVDALEVIDETGWMGSLIPLFPVLGPEIYIEGKLHRLSLIEGAIDSQRALNFVATTATELAGLIPKAPMMGPKGSFDDPKWDSLNSEVWAYLEYTPVFVTNETGQQTLAPPPQRNLWEAPIQWLIALGAWFSDSIKAVTAIYDPSLGAQKGDQSGKAIEQLRSESSVGNYSYSDNLHRAIEVMYSEMCLIFPKILDGPRAQTIIKADGSTENAEINRVFGDGARPVDPKTGQPMRKNDITLGIYSTRVTVGPSSDTRLMEAIPVLTQFFKAVPQALAIPGVASAYLSLVGQGNPKIEQMADLMAPSADGDGDPQQMQVKYQQAVQQNQQLSQVVQKLQQAIQSKLPEIEAKKFDTLIKSLTSIRVAEINASKDLDRANADRDASTLETMLGLAHDVGMQAEQHAHEQGMQEKQQQAAMDQQQDQQAGAMVQQQQAADLAPEPAGGGE